MKVLHVAAEVFPLVKTGGLADVVGALPKALIDAGTEVRLLLPGLPAIVDAVAQQRTVCEIGPMFGALRITIRSGVLPFSHVPVYLIDSPYLYRRGGGPYEDEQGREWSDNLQRFALLGWVAAHLAAGDVDTGWTPQIVHAHDWHAAMACAYMAAHPGTVARSVFTVHNLAYQGLFASGDFAQLGLPSSTWASHGIEYHGRISFMKAGLKFARRITTVSPTYATEMATHEFGCGLDGVIRSRAGDVVGILNGVDRDVWNPATDGALEQRYTAQDMSGKTLCRDALRREFGLDATPEAPLFGAVSRLSEQKGLDLILAALPALLRLGGQFCLQGSGDASLEAAFSAAAQAHPGKVAVRIGYNEAVAHRLIAGADALLVPSRFEPCGLTQLYALRYGGVPVVRRVGGLADTVVDATPKALEVDRATGFTFGAATPAALEAALQRAVLAYRVPALWAQLMQRGMAQDFSWSEAARHYVAMYAELLQDKGAAQAQAAG